MAGTDFESILADIRGESDNSQGIMGGLERPTLRSYDENIGKTVDADFNVPMDAIYDRLSDGTYTPMYENYAGAIGNEDRLASQQSGLEQFGYGIAKNANKVLNYALDATVGTVYGIYNGIKEGSMEAVWNNDFSNTLDDWNKKLDYNLPNYYTDEQKSQSWLRSLGTVNFWANDFAGGVAFVGGAVLPEIILGAVTGGATMPASLAKMGARIGMKGLTKSAIKTGVKAGVKESVESLSKAGIKKGFREAGTNLSSSPLKGFGGVQKELKRFNVTETALNNIKSVERATFIGEKVGNALNTGRFLLQSSNFEAGMEARHNFHTAMDDFYASFSEKNGRPPSYEEISEFTEDAVSAANSVYGANMAILSISNAAMFGNLFGVGVKTGKAVKKAFNPVVGLGTKNVGGKVILQKSTKLNRLVGNASFILGKPAIEGLYEEGFQGVAGATMQNYLKAKYDPDIESGYGFYSSLTEAFSHQYGTNEGWKEMVIGMMIGSVGGAFSGGGFKNGISGAFGNSRMARYNALKDQVDIANSGQAKLISRLNTATATTHFGKLVDEKTKTGEVTDVDNDLLNVAYIQTQEQVKSREEIKEDYNTVVDNLELNEEQLESIGGKENIESYKSSLKDKFNRNLESYRETQRLVEALDLTSRFKGKETYGNINEINQALVMNIMMGKSASVYSQKIASQIGDLVGSKGIVSSLDHYNSLTKEEKKKVRSLNGKRDTIARKREQAKQLLKELENTKPASPTTEEGNDVKRTNAKYKRASERYNVLNAQIAQLEIERDEIAESIKSIEKTKATDFSISNFSDNTHDIKTTVDELAKLDGLITSLESNGRKEDAEVLTRLVEDYKTYADAHREMENMLVRMRDTNFFSTKEGKALKGSIVGDKYMTSDEFRKIIRDNDAIIDKSLRMVGQRGQDVIDERINKIIGENTEISEREKFRLESLLRLQLGYEKVGARIKEFSEETEPTEVDTTKVDNVDPKKGDSVEVIRKIKVRKEDLGNIDVINDLIKRITNELDLFKQRNLKQLNINGLKGRLEKLKKQKENIENNKLEEISQAEFEKFREDETVSSKRLLDIANKKKNGQKLTSTENKFFEKKKEEVNELIDKLKDKQGLTEINKEITTLEQEIEAGEKEVSIKIINSEDFKRLDELTKKKENEELTEQEELEIEQIEQDIDQWIEISGVTVDGVSLSDLLKQRAVLTETEVLNVEDILTVTPNGKLDMIDMDDNKPGAVRVDLGQTYESVTARKEEGKIVVSGITPEAFQDEVGFPVEHEVDDRGNIILTEEEAVRINRSSPIDILPTNTNLTTSYSVVMKTTQNEGGTSTTSFLKSNFFQDEGMNPDAIYELEDGDEVFLEVNNTDEYNNNDTKGKKRGLLNRYLDAKTEKEKEKALDALKKGIVIRVKDREGNLIAILKGKRSGVSEKNGKFNALRDTIVEDEAFLERLLNQENHSEEIDLGKVTVKNVLPGQPNFIISKNEDGSVSISDKRISKKDLKKIDDYGYFSKDGPKTKKGRNDEGLDTTFLGKAVKNIGERKIPFVVIKKGNKRMAYPVKLGQIDMGGFEAFEEIFNSRGVSNVQKAGALNRFMASRGVNIKDAGNSFVVIGGNSNLKRAFFEEKLAQMKDIVHHNSIESLADKKVSPTQLQSEGLFIDLDLSNPVHSPKVSLDYSDLDVMIKNPTPSKKKAVVSKGIEALGKKINEDC